ncbi:putative Ig domain-containing protein [Desulfolithobacter sp.]
MDNRGFTLVEMAIVLVIIGLLAGMGGGIMKIAVERQKLSETRNSLDQAYESIVAWVERYKTMPTTLTSLGVKTTDAYTQNLYYATYTPAGANVCTTPGTYLQINDRGILKNNIAFILLSKGKNLCNQTGTSSPYQVLQAGTATTGCPQGSLEYDDEVRYLDITSLVNSACGQLWISTTFLHYGTVGEVYPQAQLAATGGGNHVWDQTGGSLPPGLSLSTDGVISGTPTTAGTYAFEIRVTDGIGRSARSTLSIAVNPSSGGGGGHGGGGP